MKQSDSTAEATITKTKTSAEGKEEDPERKQRKSGVIYVQTIPPQFTVAKMREALSKYGQLGRIYLQVGLLHLNLAYYTSIEYKF